MNNQLQRKFKTRLVILKGKYIKPGFLLRALVTLILIFLILPFFLYLTIRSGYSQKLLTSSDQIQEDLTTGILITDANPDTFKPLADLSKEIYQKRKINSLYVYLVGDSKSITDEDLSLQLDKIPVSVIKINRESDSPIEICDSIKNLYSLSKYLILTYKDTAIRTTFICNNQNMYARAITPVLSDEMIETSQSTVIEYIKDITWVFTGIDLTQ